MAEKAGFNLISGVIVIRRARRQTYYQPEREDWLWYALLPGSAYAAITITSCFLRTSAPFALFAIGTATLGLLIIGIRNAWDTVTHIVVFRSPGRYHKLEKVSHRKAGRAFETTKDLISAGYRNMAQCLVEMIWLLFETVLL